MRRNEEEKTRSLHELTEDGEPWLLVVADGRSEAHPLPRAATVTIGRSQTCDVVIDHASVSRRHAVLERGRLLRIRDLGSSNGSRVRERDLPRDEPVEIAPGEIVELGGVLIAVQHGSAYVPGAHAGKAKRFAPPGSAQPRSGDLVVGDPSMERLLRLVERIAQSDINVLLTGETGSGKEVVATFLHGSSPRAASRFVQVNCAAIAPSLLDDELFGHEAGAFTGARGPRVGLLEAADGGTLMLDEIGELGAEAQAKLLRVLEERRVRRLGGSESRPIDVRFVAATHRELESEVAEGRFRADLYFRLNGITVRVPPLRERPGDIEPLARHFLAQAGDARLSPSALDVLRRHRWPGNVRELHHVIHRATLLAEDGLVEPVHLVLGPPALESAERARSEAVTIPPVAAEGGSLPDELRALERARIVDTLEQCAGNQSRTAKELGMSRRTLIARLEQYGIPRPRKR